MSNHSIHHVTAVTAQIAQNHQFYTKVLGLRLVKKSVNQDDVSAYHLFYADAVGTPGTDMTFFDWPKIGADSPGLGTIACTTFRVPKGTLDYWEARLNEFDAGPLREIDELDQERILFSDPEGQRLELVEDLSQPVVGTPWGKIVPEEFAIRGILGVDLQTARADGTRRVLTEILGYEPIDREETVYVSDFASQAGRLRLVGGHNRQFGRLGAGGVHHVAFRVADDDELNRLGERIEAVGLRTSGFVDRYYFHSLYFREPGGILFELATDGPGFAADESIESLGEKLALPPFLEGRRSEIESGLRPLIPQA